MFEKNTVAKAKIFNTGSNITLNCKAVHVRQKEVQADVNDKISANLKYRVSIICPDIRVKGCCKIYLAVVMDCFRKLNVSAYISINGAYDCYLGILRQSVKALPANYSL